MMEESEQKPLRRRKPFRLLAKLSKGDIAQFRQFLESPLIQKKPDQKLLQFFDHCQALQVWQTDLDKPSFEKRSQSTWTDNAFDKMVSKLYDALTKYAALVEFLEADGQHASFALKFYERNGFEQEEIGKKVKEGKRELSDVVHDERYYRTMLELELEVAERAGSRALMPEERGILRLHDHLDSYFCILKLRFLCGSENERHIYSDAAQEDAHKALNQWFQARYATMPTLAKVYFHAYHLLQGLDDDVHVAALEEQLQLWEAECGKVSRTESAELNGYLLNYYLRKLNSGASDALRQVHHFYKAALEKGWVLEGKRISPENFKNIVTITCRMGLLEEAHAFYEDYKELLTDAQDGAAADYNAAVLAYYGKDYATMIPQLESQIDAKGAIRTDHRYGLDLRCFLLKAYFEYMGTAHLRQWDEVDEKLNSLLHAFPAYIARKNLSKSAQLRFENFKKSMQRLYTIVYVLPRPERKAKMKELLLEFRSSSNLPDRSWFIQKATAFLES